MRARGLARRRSDGEQVPDYEARLLDAHLAGCGRCRDFAASLVPEAGVQTEAPGPVVGGETGPPGAKVGAVEAASPQAGPDQPHEPSRVDAMGKDKRRQVIGHAYAPTRARQLTYYGVAIGVVVLLFIGGRIAVDELDKAPDTIENQAPWSQGDSPQAPPQRFE